MRLEDDFKCRQLWHHFIIKLTEVIKLSPCPHHDKIYKLQTKNFVKPMIHKKFRETNAIYLLTITSITCFHIFQLQIEIGENVNFMELAQKFRETNFCADKLL